MPNVLSDLSYQPCKVIWRPATAAYGSMERVKVVMNRDTGQPRGFAFIEMATRKGAKTAISQLDGTDLHGPRRTSTRRSWTL